MAPTLCPMPKAQFFSATGEPLAGGRLYTYEAGVPGTPKTTYTDSTESSLNTNPVVLDASGKANVWLSGYYYMELWTGVKTAPGSTLVWSEDNVSGFDPVFEYLTGDATFPDIITKSPWVDVRAFFDGVGSHPTLSDWVLAPGTTDVTTAVQDAIIEGTGKTVLFPEGTYLISSSLTVTASDTTLVGINGVLTAGAAISPMLLIQADRVRVQNLRLDGDNLGVKGIYIDNGCSDVVVEGCEIKNLLEPASVYTEAVGINLFRGVDRITIRNNWIHDISSPTTGIARGIRLHRGANSETASDIRVLDNIIQDISPVADADGIVLQDYTTSVRAIVRGNNLSGCAKRGIKIDAPGVVIANNQIDGAGESGYAGISCYAPNALIIGNKIVGPFTTGCVEIGSSGGSSKPDMVVCGNTMENVTGADVMRLYGTGHERWSITGNTLKTGRYGMYFTSAGDGLSIVGNTVEDADTTGIYLVGVGGSYWNDVTVSGNTLRNNGAYGVRVEGGTGIVVTGNAGSGNGTSLIAPSSGPYFTQSGNAGALRYNTSNGVPTAGTPTTGDQVWNESQDGGEAMMWLYANVGGVSGWQAPLTIVGTIDKTTDYPIVASTDIGKHFSNGGASGTVVFTLPAATKGQRYHFTRIATQTLRIDPDGSEVIKPNGVGKYISLDTDGASVELQCLTTGAWYVVSSTGTVSVEL